MAPIPPNQEPASNVRKRKIRLDDNGEPVIPVKKKRLGPQPQGKKAATTKPTPTSGKTSTKAIPAGPSRPRAASVEEVIDDEDLGRSATPRNPRNILEASDGSDDDPVISVKNKRSGSRPQGEKAATTKPTPTLRKPSMKAIPAGPSRTRAASVEEITDDEDLSRSATPRNPRNILEAANGSDDGLSESGMNVDVIDDVRETPEEDDEAELGLFSVTKL
jgi:hypothetical protein